MTLFWLLASILVMGTVYLTEKLKWLVPTPYTPENEPFELICLRWATNFVLSPIDPNHIYAFKYYWLDNLSHLIFSSLLRGVAVVCLCRFYQAFASHTDKQIRLAAIAVVTTFATYCVLAYIFMWPPVVRYFWNGRATMSICPCVWNLRAIESAIDDWARDHGKHNGDPVTFADISPYLPAPWHLITDGKIRPCYEGGTYSITVVGAEPTCSLGTNSSIPIKMRRNYFYWDFTNALGCNHRLNNQKGDPDWSLYLQYRTHPDKKFPE
jgi:hypothetical protein